MAQQIIKRKPIHAWYALFSTTMTLSADHTVQIKAKIHLDFAGAYLQNKFKILISICRNEESCSSEYGRRQK